MNKEFSYKIYDWNEIKDSYTNGSLIIGNGASIALHSKFDFKSLKEEAEKSNLFSEEIAKLFVEFDTSDFELILRLVWHAKLVNNHLGIREQKVDSAYDNIKDALIKVVKEVHCEHSGIAGHLSQLYQFTKKFQTIVSLNYDLILYWILMYGNDKNNDGHSFKDCFTNNCKFEDNWGELRRPYGVNQRYVTLVFYQHGNLSIFRDTKNIETKIQRGELTDLLQAITLNWNDEKIPLFVAEGTGDKKQESIRSSKYLSKIYYEILPKLLDSSTDLVIYGWDLGQQELHLVEQIFKNKTAAKVAISTYDKNQAECHRIYTMIKNIAPNIEVEFFDSQSSGCWNNP